MWVLMLIAISSGISTKVGIYYNSQNCETQGKIVETQSKAASGTGIPTITYACLYVDRI